MAHVQDTTPDTALLAPADDALAPLLSGRPVQPVAALPEVVVGELVALTGDGDVPLVRFAGQPGTAALPARAVPDLHAAHIGRSVVLSFEGGDPTRPIVMGVLRGAGQPATDGPGRVQVDADGERLLVTARNQLVLRCGDASITLTRAGKVLIQGTYVSSVSTGVNKVAGGSVQLN